tara:strand:- start:682 stop:1638 length:957 start_codon:yes stop_codon:yes gene_type:complete
MIPIKSILLSILISVTISASNDNSVQENKDVASNDANHNAVLIGVTDELSDSHQYSSKLPYQLTVRVLFAKQGKNWLALNSEERASVFELKELTWDIVLRDKRIGKLQTVDDLGVYNKRAPGTFARDKQHRIKDTSQLPFIKNNFKYSRWLSYPKNQPFVLQTNHNEKEQLNWSDYSAKKEDLKILVPEFKKEIKIATKCVPYPVDTIKFEVTEKDLEIFAAYKSNTNQKLFGIRILRDYFKECDWGEDDDDVTLFFFINSENDIQFLGYNLTFLDAADFDNDGQVEFIFWYSVYNADGYVLYENNFKRKHEYIWGYH